MFNLLDLEALLPEETSPEYKAQLEAIQPLCEKIEAAFSPGFLDAWLDAAGGLAEITNREHLLWGLRLGAQLTFQLLSPPPLSRTPRP